MTDDIRTLLTRTAGHAADYREAVAADPRPPAIGYHAMRERAMQPVPEAGSAAEDVIEELVALCDIQEEKLLEAASELEITRTFVSDEEMLTSGEIDAVIVATPMPLHVPQSVMALEQGIHVDSVGQGALLKILESRHRAAKAHQPVPQKHFGSGGVTLDDVRDGHLSGDLHGPNPPAAQTGQP